MKNKNLIFIICSTFIILFSCGQSVKNENTKSNDIISEKKSSIEALNDSLILSFFEYGLLYFDNDNLDNLIERYGNPIKTYKTEWCGGICDDSLITTFSYSGFTVSFFEKENSKIEIERINVFDQTTFYTENLILGKKINEEKLKKIGQHSNYTNSNFLEKNKFTIDVISKNKKSLGDTTTFIYNLNIDEYSIILVSANDTIHEILWVKNMN